MLRENRVAGGGGRNPLLDNHKSHTTKNKNKMTNGTKPDMANTNKNQPRISPSSSLGVPVGESGCVLSDQHSDMESGLYSDIHPPAFIRVRMGHSIGKQDREGIIQSKFSQKVSSIFNRSRDFFSNIIRIWPSNNRKLNRNNIPSNLISGSRGDNSPCVYDLDRRGTSVQGLGSGEVAVQRNIRQHDNDNFDGCIRVISRRDGKIVSDIIDLHPTRNHILSSKKEIQPRNQYGQCRSAFRLESVYFGFLNVNKKW